MTSPTDLAQLYILLSYEKLQRSTISQRQRPTEASLRNRLLVWRFLKKIENEPVPLTHSEQHPSTPEETNNNSWILDLNSHCNDHHDNDEINMDIDSDIVTVVSNHDISSTNYEIMDIEQEPDVTLLLKRAIGAERRQKGSTENFLTADSHGDITTNPNISNHHQISDATTLEETEQFFHDLCAELTSTTAALVSSPSSPPSPNNNLLCSSPHSEQTLIH